MENAPTSSLMKIKQVDGSYTELLPLTTTENVYIDLDAKISLDTKLANIDNKINNLVTKTVTTVESPLILNDNTEYRLSNISSLSLTYPNTNFEVWMRITFSTSAAISVTFPTDTQFIGEVPTFNNGETWEISIKDKVAICWRVG